MRISDWSSDVCSSDLFTKAAAQSGDRGFEVELRQSGLTFHIPPDKTILEVLAAAGCDPMYDCTRGECGVCQVDVLEGRPYHRDYYLSDAEKKAGKVIARTSVELGKRVSVGVDIGGRGCN